MSKSIEYKGHTVMSGTVLYDLLDDTKTHDSAQKAAKHFDEVLVNYRKLTDQERATRHEVPSAAIPAANKVAQTGGH